MKKMPIHKYKPYPHVDLPDRLWPSRTIEAAPRWCSVDLRDGNQALIDPMNIEEKLEMFRLLTGMGFKEIEVGFPSASQTEFDFLRLLIEERLIPDDVTLQVLTPSREPLIRKTFDAVRGAHRVIVHLYNSTSELQRRVVFRKNRADIIKLAVEGAGIIGEESRRCGVEEIVYEYSPESFTGTEPDFALEICEAVTGIWRPTTEHRIIINLPATVEMSTPNVYADRIEWFLSHVKNRESIILSIHPHNDRGCAVAAAELALMAGAERVEGTLFGNGERTGNVDIITLAMNMVTQGIDPGLDLHDINSIIEVCQRCTKIPLHIRHPYAGRLVYTAFSGSHQDAIRKGMKVYEETKPRYWEVPYLPIDPSDAGRNYESIIRINSQSGKGGIAYVMEKNFAMVLPKEMHPEFAAIIQRVCDEEGREISPEMIWETFDKTYFSDGGRLAIADCSVNEGPNLREGRTAIVTTLFVDGKREKLHGEGNGPIDAFVDALNNLGFSFKVDCYSEHALSTGSDSQAAAYVRMINKDGGAWWGVGRDSSIHLAPFKAIVSAINRALP